MKKYLLALLLLVPSVAQSATYYWVGTGATNWNNGSNWSLTSGGAGAALVPSTGDTAIFDSGSGLAGVYSSTCTIDIPVTVNTIEVGTGTIPSGTNGGFTGQLNFGNNTISISSFTEYSGNVYSGGSTVNLAGPFTVTNSSIQLNSSNWTITGPVFVSTATFGVNTDSANFVDNGAITVASTTFNMAGSTFTYYGNVTMNTSGALNVYNRGTSLTNFAGNGQTLFFKSNAPALFYSVYITGTGATEATSYAETFGKFWVMANSSFTTSGSFYVEAGTATLDGATAGNSSLIIIGGVTLYPNTSVGCPVAFDTNANTVYIPAGTYNGNVALNNINTSSAGTFLFRAGTHNYNAGLSIVPSTSYTGTMTADFTSNPTLNITGAFISGTVTGNVLTQTVVANFRNATINTGSIYFDTGTYTLSNSSITVSGSVVISTVTDFGSSTDSATLVVGSTMTVSTSTWIMAGDTITVNGGLVFGSSVTTGANGGTSTINFNGASPIVLYSTWNAVQFYNVNNYGNLTYYLGPGSGNVQTYGIFNIKASSQYQTNTSDFWPYMTKGSTLTINGSCNLGAGQGFQIVDNAVINGAGIINCPFIIDPVTTNSFLSALVYGGNVQTSAGNGGLSVIMGAGNAAFNGGLTFAGNNSLTFRADLNATNVTVSTITANKTNQTSTIYLGSGTWTDNGSFTCSSCVINAQQAGLNIIGAGANLVFSSSTFFNCGTSTVTFSAPAGSTNTVIISSQSVLAVSTTFYSFTDNAQGGYLQLTALSTMTVTGTLTLNGQPGNLLNVTSTTSGTQADIYLVTQSNQDVTYVNAKDNYSYTNTIYNDMGTLSNTTNWVTMKIPITSGQACILGGGL